MERFIAWLLFRNTNTTVVRVKSWKPSWGKYGPEWPVLLVNEPGYRRTVAPVWDWCRIKSLFHRGAF